MVRSLATESYTLEQLQQKYSLSISVAFEVLDRYGGDRASIDKIMKRCRRSQARTQIEETGSMSCNPRS